MATGNRSSSGGRKRTAVPYEEIDSDDAHPARAVVEVRVDRQQVEDEPTAGKGAARRLPPCSTEASHAAHARRQSDSQYADGDQTAPAGKLPAAALAPGQPLGPRSFGTCPGRSTWPRTDRTRP